MDINRKTAFFVIKDVEEKKAYSNIAMNKHVKRDKPDEVPFVRQLVYGVIRYKLYLDYIISKYTKEPISKLRRNDIIVLRMGIYQLLYMDSVPEYAAVDESVDLAKKYCKGRSSFINGLLREFIRTKNMVQLPNKDDDLIQYYSIKYSFAPWVVEMWLRDYGEREAEAIMEGCNQTPPLTLRINSLKTKREDLYKRLLKKGYDMNLSHRFSETMQIKGIDLLSGRLYKEGLYSIQDESALMAVKILDPRPNETVIDVCAAPGGKSFAAAEMMGNKGKVIAMDIYRRKLNLVNNDAKRLGISIVETNPWDATRTDSTYIEKADKVMVDAPCSGLGVAGKKPEVKYKEWDENMENLPQKQYDILRASAKYLKPGGVLVYSTCTIAKRENEEVVKRFLNNNETFEKTEERMLLPQIDGTNGFYICRLQKSDCIVCD